MIKKQKQQNSKKTCIFIKNVGLQETSNLVKHICKNLHSYPVNYERLEKLDSGQCGALESKRLRIIDERLLVITSFDMIKR